MSKTRELAKRLREEAHDTNLYGDDLREAAAAIDVLLDAIEAGGMVEPRPAPTLGVEGLRTVRHFHVLEALRGVALARPAMERMHRKFVGDLNRYFPKDDQL